MPETDVLVSLAAIPTPGEMRQPSLHSRCRTILHHFCCVNHHFELKSLFFKRSLAQDKKWQTKRLISSCMQAWKKFMFDQRIARRGHSLCVSFITNTNVSLKRQIMNTWKKMVKTTKKSRKQAMIMFEQNTFTLRKFVLESWYDRMLLSRRHRASMQNLADVFKHLQKHKEMSAFIKLAQYNMKVAMNQKNAKSRMEMIQRTYEKEDRAFAIQCLRAWRTDSLKTGRTKINAAWAIAGAMSAVRYNRFVHTMMKLSQNVIDHHHRMVIKTQKAAKKRLNEQQQKLKESERKRKEHKKTIDLHKTNTATVTQQIRDVWYVFSRN